MKKIIFGIFAHPDDEAFGPSGTLILEKDAGNDVHLITLTAGENGTNLDGHQDLGQVRLEEWHAAGKLIGANTMHHLGYMDGMLSNISLLKVADRLTEIFDEVLKGVGPDVAVECMSMDLNGVTGHIDHIVAARAACLAFYRHRQHDARFTRIRLSCIPHDYAPSSNVQWLYMDAGRRPEEIAETVDARSVLDRVYAVMRAHHTQRDDGEMHIKTRGENVAINHFLELR